MVKKVTVPEAPGFIAQTLANRRRMRLWAFIILGIIVFGVYANALKNQFTTWDDIAVYTDTLIRTPSWENTKKIFKAIYSLERHTQGNCPPCIIHLIRHSQRSFLTPSTFLSNSPEQVSAYRLIDHTQHHLSLNSQGQRYGKPSVSPYKVSSPV